MNICLTTSSITEIWLRFVTKYAKNKMSNFVIKKYIIRKIFVWINRKCHFLPNLLCQIFYNSLSNKLFAFFQFIVFDRLLLKIVHNKIRQEWYFRLIQTKFFLMIHFTRNSTFYFSIIFRCVISNSY